MKTILHRLILTPKHWVGALFDSAEAPQRAFVATCRRQQALLTRVRRSRANITSAREQLGARAVEVKSELPQLEEQARRDLLAGQEDLARFVLQQGKVAVDELEALEQQLSELEQEDGTLAVAERRLASEVRGFFARQEAIEARYGAADAGDHDARGGTPPELARFSLAVARAEPRIEDMRVNAGVISDLVEFSVQERPGPSDGDSAAQDTDGGFVPRDVEERLAALKREVGLV